MECCIYSVQQTYLFYCIYIFWLQFEKCPTDRPTADERQCNGTSDMASDINMIKPEPLSPVIPRLSSSQETPGNVSSHGRGLTVSRRLLPESLGVNVGGKCDTGPSTGTGISGSGSVVLKDISNRLAFHTYRLNKWLIYNRWRIWVNGRSFHKINWKLSDVRADGSFCD